MFKKIFNIINATVFGAVEIVCYIILFKAVKIICSDGLSMGGMLGLLGLTFCISIGVDQIKESVTALIEDKKKNK